MKTAVVFACAVLFAFGLGLAGMTDPGKIIGFLDIFGNWQPALIFVMIGAIGFHAVTFFLISRRKTPLFAPEFILPTEKKLDKRLILGAGLFGIGWGLAGYCPGPAVASLVSLSPSILVFVASMCAGIGFYHYVFKPYWLKETL